MKKKKIILLIFTIVVALVAVGAYFYIKYQTYDYMKVHKTYENSSADTANYVYCLNGVLRYSRDGVALYNIDASEVWNQPCQMNQPIVEAGGKSVAVCDKGGTSILVFEKKGLKGEIQTTRPIEKVAVSSQGVVSAILKDEEAPLVMCYDAKGNVLIEHKVSLKSMGYPIDVAISEDGNTLMVSYLQIEGNSVASKVVYYYFGEGGNVKENYQVKQSEFAKTVVPTVAFLDKDISLIVADNALVFYKGLEKPEELNRVKIEGELQSVAYGEKIVAAVVRKEDGSSYKLHIYDTKGKSLSSVDLENEYANIKAEGNQVLLFEEERCSIYMKNGICKYRGNMDEGIMEIFSIAGLNKYMVINADGFQEIRLAR